MGREAAPPIGNPELAIPGYSTLCSLLHEHAGQASTSVDALELQHDQHGSVGCRYHKSLGHDQLVDYIEVGIPTSRSRNTRTDQNSRSQAVKGNGLHYTSCTSFPDLRNIDSSPTLAS